MTRYAENTTVSVERSLAEIDATLSRYGASHFGYMREPGAAVIGCLCNGRQLRFNLPLPDRAEERFRKTPARGRQRTEEQAYQEWEQACRQCWRALCLAVKAKLETVNSGISTFESEFLAHIVDPATNKTIGETLVPAIKQAGGRNEPLQLSFAGAKA